MENDQSWLNEVLCGLRLRLQGPQKEHDKLSWKIKLDFENKREMASAMASLSSSRWQNERPNRSTNNGDMDDIIPLSVNDGGSESVNDTLVR